MLSTLGEALQDAEDWLTESGFDPSEHNLRSVVKLHYVWDEEQQCFVRRAGRFEGLYR